MPRIYDSQEEVTIGLENYKKQSQIPLPSEELMKKMRRINNYEKLNLLRAAIKSELKINQQNVA